MKEKTKKQKKNRRRKEEEERLMNNAGWTNQTHCSKSLFAHSRFLYIDSLSFIKMGEFWKYNFFYYINCGYFPFLFPLNILLVFSTFLVLKKKKTFSINFIVRKKKCEEKEKKSLNMKRSNNNWLIFLIFDLILNCFHTFWLLRPKRMEILVFFWVNLF